MADDSHFSRWLNQALAGVTPREDKDITPALPTEPSPVLIQSPRELLAAALGAQILAALARLGGTRVPTSAIAPLRERLHDAFSEGQWAHMDTEAEQVLSWLEDAFASPRRVADDEPELNWDPGSRRVIIEDAISANDDVYLEFLGSGMDPHGRRVPMFHRLRLRPEVVEERALDPGRLGLHGDEHSNLLDLPDRGLVVEGRRVPDGAPTVLALRQVRWLLAVRRLSELQESHEGKVLAFPSREDTPD